MDKIELRKIAIKRREELPEEKRRQWSFTIQERIHSHVWYKEADIILSYAAFRSEVDTGRINRWALEEKKLLFLPKTDGKNHSMEFFRTDLSSLSPGYRDIPEPGDDVPLSSLLSNMGKKVLMLMPGVAFDTECRRLGYGGGYYDRYLGAHQKQVGHRIMLAFETQRLEGITETERDIPPEQIVTNERVYKRQ